jgi:hypothetical protein
MGTLSLSTTASANSPQATSTISFTVTTTSNYQVVTGGPLLVNFNSVSLSTPPPQAYSFGIIAKTFPGLSIIRLHWEFGDGAFLDVPYCCQSFVSEVQYHAYAHPGSYTVVVVAFDNAGNFGDAFVTVNWITPVPEYPTYAIPLFISLFAVLAAAAYAKKAHSSHSVRLR